MTEIPNLNYGESFHLEEISSGKMFSSVMGMMELMTIEVKGSKTTICPDSEEMIKTLMS